MTNSLIVVVGRVLSHSPSPASVLLRIFPFSANPLILSREAVVEKSSESEFLISGLRTDARTASKEENEKR